MDAAYVGRFARRAGLRLERLPNDEFDQAQYRLVDEDTGNPLQGGPMDLREAHDECVMRAT